MVTIEVMTKDWMKAEEKMLKYFKAHPRVNALAHLLVGMGVGVLMTYPLVMNHPLRWGFALVGLGLAVHLYPLLDK
jgi:hypothetical protein